MNLGAQQTVEFKIRSSNQISLAQLWIYDAANESMLIARGVRSSGISTDGNWKFDFLIPNLTVSGLPARKGSWVMKANANDILGNGNSTGSWVTVGEFVVD